MIALFQIILKKNNDPDETIKTVIIILVCWDGYNSNRSEANGKKILYTHRN